MPKASSGTNKVLGSQSDSDVNRMMTATRASTAGHHGSGTSAAAANHSADEQQPQPQQQHGLGAIQIGSAWFQKRVSLRPQHRGVHLVTEEILRQVPELDKFAIGLCHVLIVHTSASLAINESWDPDVRDDMEMMLNRIVPEGLPFRHSCEGPDDMPAHVKACFLGSSLTIPISDGKLNLGTWQGIWLCEHRNQAGSRKLIVTLNGCLKPAASAAINNATTSSIRSPLSPTSPPPSSSS